MSEFCYYLDIQSSLPSLAISSVRLFPLQGFTILLYFYLKKPPRDNSKSVLLSFESTEHSRVTVFVDDLSLIYQSKDKHKENSLKITDAFKLNKWHFISITHTKRTLKSDLVNVYIDGVKRGSSSAIYPGKDIVNCKAKFGGSGTANGEGLQVNSTCISLGEIRDYSPVK